MEKSHTQFIEITSDLYVDIHINNSTIKAHYGMPVKDLVKILNSGFPSNVPDHPGSKDDKA